MLLLQLHGPVLSGEPLQRCLGYRSMDGFRQAILRGTVPVRVFELADRRGKHAMTLEVCRWLVACWANEPPARPVPKQLRKQVPT